MVALHIAYIAMPHGSDVQGLFSSSQSPESIYCAMINPQGCMAVQYPVSLRESKIGLTIVLPIGKAAVI
jgi:hypothetical protein